MRKLLLLVVVALVAWSYYQKEDQKSPVVGQSQSVLTERSAAYGEESIADTVSEFQCDSRQYCSQMRSRAEAEYFIRDCPNNKMDGDHDGHPCENDSRF
jgi:hypothetical protein